MKIGVGNLGNWVFRPRQFAVFRGPKVHARIKKAQNQVRGMFLILQEEFTKQTNLHKRRDDGWKKGIWLEIDLTTAKRGTGRLTPGKKEANTDRPD